MKIALDFDDTFSLDVPFWRDFCATCIRDGKDIRIVTARGEGGKRYANFYGGQKTLHVDNNRDIEKALEGLDVPIIYCGWSDLGKRYICQQEHNWDPDVWIDDRPEAITKGDYG